MVSLCFLPILLVAWLRTAEDLRVRWWFIPFFWLWSCCHGFWFVGWLLGLLVGVTMVVTRRVTGGAAFRVLSVVLASLLVVLLTPAGPRVLLAPVAVRDRSSYIIEWHRTDLTSPAPLVALLVIAGAIVAIWCSRRYDVVHLALVASAGFFTWYSSRTVSVGGMIAAVVLARALGPLLSSRQGSPFARRETFGLLAWAAACLAVLAFVVPRTSAQPGGVPIGFDPTLDTLPAGTVVFNNYEIGGWLAWRHPDLDHYIDPLADAYSVNHLHRYGLALQAEPGWKQILLSSRARVAVLQRDVPLNAALQNEGWIVEGATRGYVLLESPVDLLDQGRSRVAGLTTNNQRIHANCIQTPTTTTSAARDQR
jgi:hypothetical protein